MIDDRRFSMESLIVAEIEEVLRVVTDLAARLERIERRLAPGHSMTPADVDLLKLIHEHFDLVAFSSRDLQAGVGSEPLKAYQLTDLTKIGRRLGAIERRLPVGPLRLVDAGSCAEGRLFAIARVDDDEDDDIVHRHRPHGFAAITTASSNHDAKQSGSPT